MYLSCHWFSCKRHSNFLEGLWQWNLQFWFTWVSPLPQGWRRFAVKLIFSIMTVLPTCSKAFSEAKMPCRCLWRRQLHAQVILLATAESVKRDGHGWSNQVARGPGVVESRSNEDSQHHSSYFPSSMMHAVWCFHMPQSKHCCHMLFYGQGIKSSLG